MGNSQVAISQDQVDQASEEMHQIMKAAGVDDSGDIVSEDWQKVFRCLDANDDKVISRKEWCLQLGTTEVFDAIHKRNNASITQVEWHQAFLDLDVQNVGKISFASWQGRRRVDLTMQSLGYGRNHWGVRVSDLIFEVPFPQADMVGSEIAILGPEGIVSLAGDLRTDEAARTKWMEEMLKASQDGARPQSSWVESRTEPRSLPMDAWTDFQQAGWTSKTDDEIQTWLKAWAVEHPTYLSFHALGKEINNQTFTLDFIGFLTGAPFSKWTDGTKGRALAVGGALVLGGIAAFAVYRTSQNKKDGDGSPTDSPSLANGAAAPAVADKK